MNIATIIVALPCFIMIPVMLLFGQLMINIQVPTLRNKPRQAIRIMSYFASIASFGMGLSFFMVPHYQLLARSFFDSSTGVVPIILLFLAYFTAIFLLIRFISIRNMPSGSTKKRI